MSHRLCAAVAAGLVATASAARPAVVVSQAWSRPTLAGAPTAVGYLRVLNHGPTADRLIGGRSSRASRIEIHRTTVVGGVTRMRKVEGGVAIAAGGSLVLAPNGYHLMFVAPALPFRAGDRIGATLRFEHAGDVPVSFEVRGAAGADMVMR